MRENFEGPEEQILEEPELLEDADLTAFKDDFAAAMEAIEDADWLLFDVCLKNVLDQIPHLDLSDQDRENFLTRLITIEDKIQKIEIPEHILARRIKNNFSKAKRLLQNNHQ